jgi:TatA/E family protein of Tat protein translocase
MFGSLGIQELIFIFVIALLIFGPKRLPQIGRTLGKGMAEFRRASNELKRSIEREVDLDDKTPRLAARPSPGPAKRESEADSEPTDSASQAS